MPFLHLYDACYDLLSSKAFHSVTDSLALSYDFLLAVTCTAGSTPTNPCGTTYPTNSGWFNIGCLWHVLLDMQKVLKSNMWFYSEHCTSYCPLMQNALQEKSTTPMRHQVPALHIVTKVAKLLFLIVFDVLWLAWPIMTTQACCHA